jgi:hypothetical protein
MATAPYCGFGKVSSDDDSEGDEGAPHPPSDGGAGPDCAPCTATGHRAMGSTPAPLPERNRRRRSLRLTPQAMPVTSRSIPRRYRMAQKTLSPSHQSP